jgi:Flp pilus assembly pilin Flp
VKGDEALAISEYALLVAFIAIVVVAVLTLFGGQVSGWLSNRTGTITTV